MNKIPVMGTLVVNHLQIQNLLDSVDYPVEHFVIFNNNGKGENTTDLDSIAATPHPFIENLKVCHLPDNVGVSCGWNLIIKSFINAPYWIICNDDVSFEKGFLEEMYETAQDSEIGLIHGDEGDYYLGSWCVFLIKDWVIQRLGLFDENMTPAYGEDTDYTMRMRSLYFQAGGKGDPRKESKNLEWPKRIIGLKKRFYHGGELSGEEESYYKYGKQVSKHDEELGKKLLHSNYANFEYMTEKWGEDWRVQVPWWAPFDKKDIPLSYTTFDLGFLRSKTTQEPFK